MRYMTICVCLAVASISAAAGPTGNACSKELSALQLSSPLSIADIERQQMEEIAEKRKIRSDLPEVPFAFGNAEWLQFKKKIRAGDKIVRYSTDAHSWRNFAGEAGYALIRNGCMTARFVTLMN